jgi:hypothetical protein
MVGSNGNFVQDGFHFGEKIGLSWTFMQNPTDFYNKSYLMINGFGINVLPGAIGLTLGGNNKDIAITGLVVDAQNTLANIVAFLILFEISNYISKKYKWKVFLLFVLVYFSLNNLLILIQDRDLIFLIQVFLSIRWLRLELNQDASTKFNYNHVIYPLSLGFSIPVSLLYAYDRATYFIFVFVFLFVYFAITKGRRFYLNWGLVAVVSILLTCLLFTLIFGFRYLPVSIEHLLYWSKYSGLFTSLPYPEINVSLTNLVNWLSIFLQSCSITILCLKFRYERLILGNSFRGFLSEHSVSIFMLLCALLYMRVALGRSDTGHIMSSGFFSIFSFASILSRHFVQQKLSGISFSSVIVTSIIIASLVNMNSVAAAVNVFGMLSYPSLEKSIFSKDNSELVNPDRLKAANQIKDELVGQSCFYTLPSDGIWYRILSMKPCSKYWYLIYSSSVESQNELVRNLEEEKPKIILYSYPFLPNASIPNGIDGVSKETSHLLVHQYIWRNYRPYKILYGSWFWIRRQPTVKLSNLLVPLPNEIHGYFEELKPLNNNYQLDVSASGWYILNNENTSNQKVVFITYSSLSSPNDIEFINVGLASADRYDVALNINKSSALRSGWSISFNKLNLPPENMVIRAWAYNPKDYKLYEIPSYPPSLKTVKGELLNDKTRIR